MAKPVLKDEVIENLIVNGIMPGKGRPGFKSGSKPCLKENIKRQLRILDEQDAVNRYVWYNLPANITSQELEKMLYYKGQLCFFYMEELDEFYVMPYAGENSIDFYGRWNSVHPVPMSNGTDQEYGTAQADILAQKHLKCVYGIKMPEDVTYEDFIGSAVLLHDYTKQLSQTITPRQIVNDGLLDIMSECMPFMRTSLINETGVKGVRVNDADQAASVVDGSNSLTNAALTGDMYVPIVGSIEFQELTNGGTGKAEDFMLAMQSLDNYRLSLYGISNGGLFEKKAHELQSEADINGGPVGLVLQDGLSIRQNFCNICNSIWGTSIWCEPAENIMGADLNGDGLMYDRNENGENGGIDNDQSNSEL